MEWCCQHQILFLSRVGVFMRNAWSLLSQILSRTCTILQLQPIHPVDVSLKFPGSDEASDHCFVSTHFVSYHKWIFFPFAFQFTFLSPQILCNGWSSWNAYYFDLWPFCGANRVPDIVIPCSLIIFPAARQTARQPKPCLQPCVGRFLLFQIITVWYFGFS